MQPESRQFAEPVLHENDAALDADRLTEWHKLDAHHSGESGALADAVRERMCSVLRGKSIRTISVETGFCPETVRRYLRSSKCSVEFVARLCERYALNADWLLFGRGQPEQARHAQHVLESTDVPSILIELAQRWQHLEHRLDAVTERLETVSRKLDEDPASRIGPSRGPQRSAR